MLSLPPDYSVPYLNYFMDANKRKINEMLGYKLKSSKMCHEIDNMDDLKKESERNKLKDAMIKSKGKKN